MGINVMLRRHKSTIVGLDVALAGLQENINLENQARVAAIGEKSLLETTAKNNLVAAINEVLAVASAASDAGADFLRKDDNLAAVLDKGVARTNLGVDSSEEVDEKILAAALALGTNFTVDTTAERDLMEGLTSDDRVTVRDVDGNGWVTYKPTAVDGDGKGTAWMVFGSQEAFEREMTAEQIAAAYEGLDDTNKFQDAEKSKLGHITVTEDVDLDDAVFKADLVQDLEAAIVDGDSKVASVDAMKAYVQAAAASSTTQVALESVVVAAGEVTLEHTPQGGRAGIHNFGMVRFVDVDGAGYDLPVTATTDPKVFAIGDMGSLDLNGKTVHVQYTYAAYDAFEIVWPVV